MFKSVFIDEFVGVKAGEPYRLFPFGRIVKNGKVRELTPEYAAKIQLPHFKPAIKLGSHEDATPAGGHIVALEVRADGLYAVPEFNEKGETALRDGAYRYHSPEIIWEGGLEDPTSGSVINAPLIVGDALLHTPHLGEWAALYSVEEITHMEKSTMENVTIPQSFWDKYIAPLLTKAPEVVEKTIEKEPEDYSALKTKVAEYEAEKMAVKAEAERKARVEKFNTELKETKVSEAPALADLLAELPEEKASEVLRQFKALSAQIDESKLRGEKGDASDGVAEGDPKIAFNNTVLSIAKDKKLSYVDAFESAKVSHAELFNLAYKK